MSPGELMGQLNYNLQNVAPESSRYKRRVDGSVRAFCGCSFEMFGDMQQLPPIPSSTALFNPPVNKKSQLAPLELLGAAEAGRAEEAVLVRVA
mgnify:CR=1 FL=1